MNHQNEAAAQCDSNKGGMISREKYWDELGIEGQVDRLRDEVIRLTRLLSAAERLLTELHSHSHVEGKIVVPLDDGHRNESSFRPNGIPHRLRKNSEM